MIDLVNLMFLVAVILSIPSAVLLLLVTLNTIFCWLFDKKSKQDYLESSVEYIVDHTGKSDGFVVITYMVVTSLGIFIGTTAFSLYAENVEILIHWTKILWVLALYLPFGLRSLIRFIRKFVKVEISVSKRV
jgi:hypothetical protein